jgi:hypothetical protein
MVYLHFLHFIDKAIIKNSGVNALTIRDGGKHGNHAKGYVFIRLPLNSIFEDISAQRDFWVVRGREVIQIMNNTAGANVFPQS